MIESRITAAIWPWGTKTREQMELAAKEVTEIGYKSFESVKAAIYAFDLDINAYKEVLKRYDLTPVSFYFHLPDFNLGKEGENSIFSNLDNELDFISKLGVERICLQATLGRPEVMDAKALDYELDLVCRFAERTKKFGITSNLHPHRNTWVMYEEEIDYILGKTSADLLQFAPDTAHLVVGDCDPYEVIKKYIDRVNFTHFKDIDLKADTKSRGLASAGMEVFGDFTELGKGSGCIDFKKVFQLLKDNNYDGPLCVELDTAPVSNAESAANNFKFLLENY